jgi:CO/xanthine dehydrogenase Mo-binding subunit
MINPAIVEGQVIGAAVHGIEASLFANLPYSPEGQLLATSFTDFLSVTASDVPKIEVEHFVTPSTAGPEGIRGVGEGGGTAVSALAAAIEDALAPFGARFSDSHFTPEGILAAIRRPAAPTEATSVAAASRRRAPTTRRAPPARPTPRRTSGPRAHRSGGRR